MSLMPLSNAARTACAVRPPCWCDEPNPNSGIRVQVSLSGTLDTMESEGEGGRAAMNQNRPIRGNGPSKLRGKVPRGVGGTKKWISGVTPY